MRPRLRLKLRLARPLVGAGALLLTFGCAVGPDFKRPQPESPSSWSPAASSASADAPSPARSDAPFDGRDWWTVFRDPLLDRLVEEANAQNLDLQTAALRIAAARAQREQAGGKLYPEVSGFGTAARTRLSENGILGSSGGGSSGGGAPSPLTNLFQVGFDALWELDLWGGTRRGVEAATADVESAERARNEAQASLCAEVARAYLSVRGAERQRAIARENIETEQRLLALVDSQKRAGLASQSEVAAQATQLRAAQAQLPTLEQ